MIASSPTDVKPVLNAIVESACELCGAYDAVVRLKDGDDLAVRRPSRHRYPVGLETCADQPRLDSRDARCWTQSRCMSTTCDLPKETNFPSAQR